MRTSINLESFGLNKKETLVYVSLLEIGVGTALRISKKAGIPKSTTFDVLDKLASRGYVTSYTKKGKKYFSPADPEILREKVEFQEKMLQKVLPELKAINNLAGSRPRVRFYEDKIGIEAGLKELLKEAKEFVFFGNVDAAYKAFPEYFPMATQKRLSQKIVTRGFTVDGQVARKFKKDDPVSLRRTKILESKIRITPVAWLWNNKLLIFNTVDTPSVFIIEDREIVNLVLAMFEMIWENVPEI